MNDDYSKDYDKALRRIEEARRTGATELSLAGLQIKRLPHEVAGLKGLHSLNLSWCRQISDLTPLADLKELQSLDLGVCHQMTDLSPLKGLKGLHSLNLSGCDQITDLTPLAGLAELQSLDLRVCQQISDLRPLKGLAGLQSLNLAGCEQITDLSHLGGLSSLKRINLLNTGAQLDCAPDARPLASLPVIEEVVADTLLSAPGELGSTSYSDNALPRIRAWQRDLARGEAEHSTVKALTLGNGRVGKTQIVRRLQGLPYDESVPSTHGIDLGAAELAPAQDDQPAVQGRLWDFGGQDIYLGAHALFLDERAVYVLVWSPEFENHDETEEKGLPLRNRPLAYWLAYIRSLAGPQAPIIVFQTRCDDDAELAAVPLPPDHGFGRLRATHGCAKDEDGLDRLRPELKRAARRQVKEYGKVRLPQSWVDVGDVLEARKKEKTMAYTDYEDLCRDGRQVSAPQVTLEYLHRSGRLFYKEGLFDNQVVLHLSWALDGVYALLDRKRVVPQLRERQGFFSRGLLEALAWQDRSPQECDLFLSMMQQCGLCFEVGEDLYLAPDFLPPEEDDSGEGFWQGARADAKVRLDYDFLQDGLLRSLVSAVGRLAGAKAAYWKYGACFYDSVSKSKARILSTLPDIQAGDFSGSITVETAGPQARELAEKVVKLIQRADYGHEPEVNWQHGAEEGRDVQTLHTRDDEPSQSIQPATPPHRPGEKRNVYVSYGWNDPSFSILDEIERLLPEDIELLYDRKALNTGDNIQKFMEKIGRSRLILVLLSKEYFHKENCMQELFNIFREKRKDTNLFTNAICPVVVDKVGFYKDEEQDALKKYWDEEHQGLIEKKDKSQDEETRHHWATRANKVGDIKDHFLKMITAISKILNPRCTEFETHEKAALDIIDLIKRRLAEQDAAPNDRP